TGMGWGFPAVGIGVALLCPVAVVRLNRVLVALSGAQTRNKKFPYSRLVPSNMHRTGLFVPTVKIADHRYPACIGRPNGKVNTGSGKVLNQMRPQLVIKLI